MSLEEEYNKIISDKLNSRSFEPSEEDWQNALALIKANEEKKKRRFFIWFIFLGAIGTFALVYFIGDSGKGFEEKGISLKADLKNDDASTTNATHNNSNNIKPLIRDTSISLTNNKANFTETENISKQENTISEKEKVANKSSSSLLKTSTTKTKKSPNITVVKTIEDAPVKATQKENNTITNLKEVNSDTVQNKIVVMVESKKDSAIAIKETPIKDSSVVEMKPELALPTATLSSIQQKDSVIETKNYLEIHAMVGTAYTPGYSSNPSVIKGINPLAGIFLVKSFSNNLGLSVGCNYMSFGNIDDNPKTYTSTFQEFGYKNEVTEIYTTSLHYINAPIMLNFKKSKNDFGIGAQFSYLFGASSQVKIYNQAYGVKTNKDSYNIYGYTTGIKPYDISAIISYRRNLSGNYGFGINLNYGLIDVKENAFFNSEKFERNSSLQIFLTYKLYK